MGIKTKVFFDALGRTTYTVAAWDGSFDPTGGGLPANSSANQTTAYTYDGDGHMLTETAVMPSCPLNEPHLESASALGEDACVQFKGGAHAKIIEDITAGVLGAGSGAAA